MVEISSVSPDSLAANYDIQAGDELLAINGQAVRDYIDFQYKTAEPIFELTIRTNEGTKKEIEIHRKYNQQLGLNFDSIVFDNLKSCKNKCIFCFVEQLPTGLRNSLLQKDDDYRFSFLQGSFITLSNLNDQDFQRIINYNLSPLNISVHTTNPSLRKKMMKNPKAADIKEQLKLLAQNNIEFNTQIVLCPGFNDGRKLNKTIEDLAKFHPSILSLGIVPVGLTKFNPNPNLKPVNKTKAKKVCDKIKEYQQLYQNKHGSNWIYLADEFYLLAGKNIPSYEHYNNFPQLENGIGLTRLSRKKYQEIKTKIKHKNYQKEFGIITSVLGKEALKPIIKELQQDYNLSLRLLEVKNKFFGSSVTVTGLLTAQDIMQYIKSKETPHNLFLPSVVLNDQNYFLDDLSFQEFQEEIPNKNIYLVSDITEIIEVII